MDISVLCSQLSVMLGAGINISRVLDNLETQCNKSSLRLALKSIKEDVIKGQSIHSSMAKFKNIFPNFMIEMIRVGEISGKLDEVLAKLSEYYEKKNNIISTIKASLIYPVVTLITSIFIVMFLMIKIIPQFTDIIQSNGGEIPTLTRVVMYICQFLKLYYLQGTIIISLILLLSCKFSKSSRGRKIRESIKFRIPYFNKMYNKMFIFKICSAMTVLSESGVNILKALKIIRNLIGSEVMAERLENSIKYIEQGENMSDALNKARINDKLFISLITTGEETGKMDLMFAKLEKLFGSELDRYFEKSTKVIEPMIIIILSLFVGIFIISALMPIFTIMDSTL
ncbi:MULTISPECIES: type II secretion system F family protein [Clostridium]|uniref:Type II secretion system protein F n=1 Tax=Clostridium ragsdalei P11 TaxID=1353534 RepID=A0A1A6AXY6_9CLOT|nr:MULTISPECIES: type II secretion system F family protein [Clostridium]OBR94917.1 type II secretion system protein F [Clostridium ragsdalei P11]QXE20331.1 type II secretion system protein F [Clostridium sp. 001]